MQILDEDGVRNMTRELGKFNKQDLDSDYKEWQIWCSWKIGIGSNPT